MTTSTQTQTARTQKPPPAGPAPPAPQPSANSNPNSTAPPPARTNGTAGGKGKKKAEPPPPPDPAAMYESLRNRIAALEEHEVQEEEEERAFAEEAVKSVKGLEDSAVHAKYIELFAEMKRVEREHQKEKQKLTKDKDAAKSQLSKANQGKTKMENLARELQKENKKLREDSKRMADSMQLAQGEISALKTDITRRIERARAQDAKWRSTPDVVLKVVCRYRAELFFKISRKTKLARLFGAWTERMDTSSDSPAGKTKDGETEGEGEGDEPKNQAQFLFSHAGRTLDAESTAEEAGLEDGDEILAVELLDLTAEPYPLSSSNNQREILAKHWPVAYYSAHEDGAKAERMARDEAARTLEEVFDGVVRERLKDVLRQYALRERHFECVVRSKELEVLLSRARAAEQHQLAETDHARAQALEEENAQLRRELDDAHTGQTMLVDRLIACCKEPGSERTQKLFATLGEELEKRRNAAAAAAARPPGGATGSADVNGVAPTPPPAAAG
ncbi:unnamed protein product [Peniophora sp. CBMAI 1063]|nr:unnamed protein product [Peniophora sp. CBMAI 1063]